MSDTRIEFLSKRTVEKIRMDAFMSEEIERGYARPNNPSHWVKIDVGMVENQRERDQGEVI